MKLPALALALDLVISLPLAHAGEEAVRLSEEQAKAAAVSLQPIAAFKSSGARRLPAQAVVPPRNVEVISAPSAGMVTGVLVAYGESVKKGQPLARLTGPQLLELQREAVQARSQAEVAQENLRRDESLFADGIVSQSRLSGTRAAERQARAQLAEKSAALRLAGAADPGADAKGLSGSAEVRAPFAGVVLEAPAQAGQRVEATAMLFKLGRIAPLWLEIQATPAQAAGLAVGDVVSVGGCAQEGRLTLIAPHVNPATQALLLRAELPNGDGCLKPFQYINAQIAPAQAPAAGNFRVPNGALTRHRGQAWLFVANANGFVPVAVKVIDETEKSSLVAAPLGEDAQIAVRGIAALKAAWLGIGGGEK